MHIGTMVEFAFALVAKLDAINKHSFNDFKLRVGRWSRACLKAGLQQPPHGPTQLPAKAALSCTAVTDGRTQLWAQKRLFAKVRKGKGRKKNLLWLVRLDPICKHLEVS